MAERRPEDSQKSAKMEEHKVLQHQMENSCTGIEKTRNAHTNKYCNLCFMESETAPNNK